METTVHHWGDVTAVVDSVEVYRIEIYIYTRKYLHTLTRKERGERERERERERCKNRDTMTDIQK